VITYLLIGLTVAASFLAWSKPELFAKLMMNPYRIYRHHEYSRFVLSGFIHKDHMHLFMNMFSFYFFGFSIERQFKLLFGSVGGIYFLALYFLAIVVSDIPTYFKQKHNPGYNSLGASGGVSAIIFAFIIFKPLSNICIYIALCMPGFILGTLYIAFSYYQGKKSNDNVNHDAHLYGAVFGLIFCVVLYPAALPEFVEQIRNWPFLEKIF
jgi:membrane associated rhomboid family serine protease